MSMGGGGRGGYQGGESYHRGGGERGGRGGYRGGRGGGNHLKMGEVKEVPNMALQDKLKDNFDFS